jgi:hypothetical protein
MYSEVVFLYQKMVLVGAMRLVKPGLMQGSLSILFSIGIICWISNTMPSNTMPYNKANIFSQATIIMTYFASLWAQSVRSGPCNSQDESEKIIMLAVGSMVLLMMLYLVKIACECHDNFHIDQFECVYL